MHWCDRITCVAAARWTVDYSLVLVAHEGVLSGKVVTANGTSKNNSNKSHSLCAEVWCRTAKCPKIVRKSDIFHNNLIFVGLTSLSLLCNVNLNPGSKSFWLFTSSSAKRAAGMHAWPPCQPPFPAMGKMPPMCSSSYPCAFSVLKIHQPIIIQWIKYDFSWNEAARVAVVAAVARAPCNDRTKFNIMNTRRNPIHNDLTVKCKLLCAAVMMMTVWNAEIYNRVPPYDRKRSNIAHTHSHKHTSTPNSINLNSQRLAFLFFCFVSSSFCSCFFFLFFVFRLNYIFRRRW